MQCMALHCICISISIFIALHYIACLFCSCCLSTNCPKAIPRQQQIRQRCTFSPAGCVGCAPAFRNGDLGGRRDAISSMWDVIWIPFGAFVHTWSINNRVLGPWGPEHSWDDTSILMAAAVRARPRRALIFGVWSHKQLLPFFSGFGALGYSK